MFSVPIIHYPIDNWEQNKKRILDVLPLDCPEHCDPENDGLYTDFFLAEDESITEMPEYSKTVIDIIKPYLFDFYKEGKIEFIDMWYQRYYKGVQHTIHNHGHSGWSSVIYVELDPDEHEGTNFISPFNDMWTGDTQFYTPDVREGDMVLFPSPILHEALPNKSDKRRTVISYNLRGHVNKVKVTL